MKKQQPQKLMAVAVCSFAFVAGCLRADETKTNALEKGDSDQPAASASEGIVTTASVLKEGSPSQADFKAIGVKITKNPDQVPANIAVRNPGDVRIYEIEFPAYFKRQEAKAKSYRDLKDTIAVVVELSVENDGFVKNPHLAGITQVSREFSHLLQGEKYYFAAHSSTGFSSIFQVSNTRTGEALGFSVIGKGKLTYLWFIPTGTTKFDIAFPDKQVIALELVAKK